MRKAVTLAGCAVLLAWSAGAAAQQLENPRTDYTAYTRPRGRASVGFLKTDLGVIDEILIGTYPLAVARVPDPQNDGSERLRQGSKSLVGPAHARAGR